MKHAPDTKEEGSLTDEEIEAILAQEAAQPPEAGEKPPEPRLVERVPGQGNYRRWMAWALVAFIAIGVLNAYR